MTPYQKLNLSHCFITKSCDFVLFWRPPSQGRTSFSSSAEVSSKKLQLVTASGSTSNNALPVSQSVPPITASKWALFPFSFFSLSPLLSLLLLSVLHLRIVYLFIFVYFEWWMWLVMRISCCWQWGFLVGFVLLSRGYFLVCSFDFLDLVVALEFLFLLYFTLFAEQSNLCQLPMISITMLT